MTAQQAFVRACVDGRLDLAKRLLSIKPTINISTLNESAFRITCYNGHIEVAKWLLAIKPTIDISADDEYAFRYACSNGHVKVATWLLEIKPSIAFHPFRESKCNNIQTQFIQLRKNKLFCTMYALEHDDIAYECLSYV